MQNPDADTEWNDALRKFNILPPKAKAEEATITEADVIKMVEETVAEKSTSKAFEDMTLEELEALEDEEDERVLLEYRRKRMLEMKMLSERSRFGELTEISGEDYVKEVNKAGDGVWVVLHLYQQGVPQCTLLNRHLNVLARKFPQTKFVKSIATLCIKDYPECNLPTIFVYFEGQMRKQLVGPVSCGGMTASVEDLEWMLHEIGAVKSDMDSAPKKAVKDVLFSALRTNRNTDGNSSDENDW